MKSSMILVLWLSSIAALAQEVMPAFDPHTWEAPYVLPAPKDWGTERFLIPISFAPEIPYKGIEDIRFTPGWAKVKSEEYWSYAFLWYLEGEVAVDSKVVESNLGAYYTGLVRVNGSKIPPDKIIPVMTSFRDSKTESGDRATFAGTISMTDYMSQKPIALNCKVHVKSCPGSNRTFIFYELSPQPLSHSVWSNLDKLWLDFKCEKN